MAAKKQPTRAPAKKAPASRGAAPAPAGTTPKPGQPAPVSSPAGLAAIIGMGIGALMIINGILTAAKVGLEMASFSIGVISIGSILIASAWFMLRGKRAGWAFFIGVTGPFAAYTLLGAPRIKLVLADLMSDASAGVQWSFALAPTLIYSALCILAALDYERFEDVA